MENLLDWLTLHMTPGLGPAGCRILLDRFGGPEKVLAADSQALGKIPGIKHDAVQALLKKSAADAAEREFQAICRQGVSVITWLDQDYPDLLRNIHNPPLLLYVKGNRASLSRKGVAIVGARAASTYGQDIARHVSFLLAQKGMAVVSGVALGIDAAAHRGALAADGVTIGVLGCGVDVVYPFHNRELFQAIPAHGALVSEYPLGTKPDGFRFPARNRIISGLSLGIVVVEAARRSGSLITAQLALEQGREVFAVPGRIDSRKSEGSHRLLQDGAKLVQCVDDILEEFALDFAASKPVNTRTTAGTKQERADLSGEEQKVYSFLDAYPKSIDEIITATGLAANKVNELLLLLELKGLIDALPGRLYSRKTAPQ